MMWYCNYPECIMVMYFWKEIPVIMLVQNGCLYHVSIIFNDTKICENHLKSQHLKGEVIRLTGFAKKKHYIHWFFCLWFSHFNSIVSNNFQLHVYIPKLLKHKLSVITRIRSYVRKQVDTLQHQFKADFYT